MIESRYLMRFDYQTFKHSDNYGFEGQNQYNLDVENFD